MRKWDVYYWSGGDYHKITIRAHDVGQLAEIITDGNRNPDSVTVYNFDVDAIVKVELHAEAVK